MTGEIENVKNLFKDRLELYQQIHAILENILANKQGTQWGVDKLKAVKDRFSILKEMDIKEEKICIAKNEFEKDEAITALANELKIKMLGVKHLLSLLHIRLEGGKQMISLRLRNISKGKRIKGYKNSEKIFSESNTCIC